MLQNGLKIAIVFICGIYLIGCNADNSIYQKGLPKEASSGFLTYLQDYLTSDHDHYLYRKGEKVLYAEPISNRTSTTSKYYSISDAAVEEYFESLFVSEEPDKTFKELTLGEHALDTIKQPVEPSKLNLPELILEPNNQLTIKTSKSEKTFNLPDLLADYNVKDQDELHIMIHSVNDATFTINIENKAQKGAKGFIDIFMKQDLTDIAFTSSYYEPYRKSVVNGELDAFRESVIEEELNDAYDLLADGYGVLNIKENKIETVDEKDFVSEDGKYVYINGNAEKLKDGKQRIQRIEDYIENHNDYEAEFQLNYKVIAEELGLKTSGLTIADIHYFSKDFIVLRLSFAGVVIGTAGHTNVLIEIQEDQNQPKMYLIDLELW